MPAHTSSWAFLARYEDLQQSFPKSPTVKLRVLSYWNDAASATNDTAANDLALRIDDHFANRMMVPYEPDHNLATARQAFMLIAREGDNTVHDLAEAVDEVFDFFGEDA